MNAEQIINNIIKNPGFISIKETPTLSIHLFESSPFALIVEKNEHVSQKKLVLLEELIESINTEFSPKKKNKNQLLEPGTIFQNKKLKIVFFEEKKYKIHYLEKNKLKSKTFIAPRRIWIIKKRKNKAVTKIFAAGEWNEWKTKIYKIPFPNTYENGNICWGLQPRTDFKENVTAQYLDNLYFTGSAFTHDNNIIVYTNPELTATDFIEKYNRVPDYSKLLQIGTLQEIIEDEGG